METCPWTSMSSSQTLMWRTGFMAALLKISTKWICSKSHPISIWPPVQKKRLLLWTFPRLVSTVQKECSTWASKNVFFARRESLSIIPLASVKIATVNWLMNLELLFADFAKPNLTLFWTRILKNAKSVYQLKKWARIRKAAFKFNAHLKNHW